MIFLKCKIRFIYVGFNCKRKKVGKKNVWKFCHSGWGVRRLMANAILNFHFDFLYPSLNAAAVTGLAKKGMCDHERAFRVHTRLFMGGLGHQQPLLKTFLVNFIAY